MPPHTRGPLLQCKLDSFTWLTTFRRLSTTGEDQMMVPVMKPRFEETR